MRHVKRAAALARLLVKPRQFGEHLRELTDRAQAAATFGPLFQKYRAYTMLYPQTFVHNLQLVDAYRGVKGCVVECGVWRGGSLAAIAEVLGPERSYHAFDSFAGLPPARAVDGPAARQWQADATAPGFHDNCKAEQEYVERAMQLAGAGRVNIHPGWFEETLPAFRPDEPIAVLRLDGDWYDSTMTCLRNLFPHVVAGGLVIIDDYYAWDGCARAVHDYLAEVKSSARIRQWRDDVAYLVVPQRATVTHKPAC